jgi:hypothetical protein
MDEQPKHGPLCSDAAVAVDLYHVLPGVRVRRAHDSQQDFVHILPVSGIDNMAIE